MNLLSVYKKQVQETSLNKPVFLSASFLIILFCLVTDIYPAEMTSWLIELRNKLSSGFAWYYLIVIAIYLFFIIGLAFSRFGKIKLGADDSQPEFSYKAWAGMLFSSGIGISLLYFGASEALTHYMHPPTGQPQTIETARQSIMLTFLHWGIHGWAIYALMAVVLGYFAYRHNRPLALRTGLYPLIGERVNGPAGHIVDSFGIIVTVFGLVSNLGIGTLQINAGLSALFGLENSYKLMIITMAVLMSVAAIAAISGIETGIKRLSNLNICLFAFLLIYITALGPTQLLFKTFFLNLFDYATNFLDKTFETYLDSPDQSWLSKWTVFYWAWWVAWAPFVGLFIARISKGRTIRELVAGVLILPLGFTLVWLSVFGNSALNIVLNHDGSTLIETALVKPAVTIYELMSYYPASQFLIGLTIFVGFVLFLTPADSGAVMLANLSVHKLPHQEDAPNWLRIFWAVMIFAATAGLMYANNIAALQTAIVLASLPFSFILLLYIIGLIKGLRSENMYK